MIARCTGLLGDVVPPVPPAVTTAALQAVSKAMPCLLVIISVCCWTSTIISGMVVPIVGSLLLYSFRNESAPLAELSM